MGAIGEDRVGTEPGADPGGSGTSGAAGAAGAAGATVVISQSADPSGAVVLALSGEIDLSSVALVQAEVDRVLESKPESIVFDMSELSFMDSSGIAVLLGCAARVGSVQVRNPSTVVRRVIELSGLTATLPMTP